MVRTWDFTEALVKQEQAQRAKQARADHKQQKRLRAQAAALAALNPPDESSEDPSHVHENGPDNQAAHQHSADSSAQHLTSPDDPACVGSNPHGSQHIIDAAAAAEQQPHGPSHANTSLHDTSHHGDPAEIRGTRAQSAPVSLHAAHQADTDGATASPAGVLAAGTDFNAPRAMSPSGGRAIPSPSNVVVSLPKKKGTSLQEERPGIAWAVGGSRAHEGTTHFQAWHAAPTGLGTHSGGAGGRDHRSVILSSSPQCDNGIGHDVPDSPRASEDDAQDADSQQDWEWGGESSQSGWGWGHRRGRRSRSASLGPHEGCNAEEGCDGHCCSLDQPTAGFHGAGQSGSNAHLYGIHSGRPHDAQHHHPHSNQLSQQAAGWNASSQMSSSGDPARWGRNGGRRRGLYPSPSVPTPIGRSSSGDASGRTRWTGSGSRPAAPGHTAQDSCRGEAGMESWQIVRPRPVAHREHN